MKLNIKNKTSFYILCFITISFLFLCIYHYLFYYQFRFKEQSNIFLFANDFFLKYIFLPGGFASYMGDFLTSFFKQPILSFITVFIVFSSLWFLYKSILKAFNQTDYFLFAIYPVLFSAFLFSKLDYNLSIITAHLLTSLICLFYISIEKDFFRYLSGIIAVFILYWMSNIIFYSGIAVFILFEICCKRHKFFFIPCVLYLLISIPLPDMANQYLSIPKSESHFSGFWIMKASVFLKDIQLIYLSVAILPITCLFAFLVNLILKKQKKTLFMIPIHIMLILLLTVIFYKDSFNKEESNYLKTLYLLREEKWDEIIKQVNKENAEYAEMFAYNFALAKKGKISEQLLSASQNSAEYYKPEIVQGILKYCLTSEVYLHLGLLNGSFYGYMNINHALNKYAGAYCISKLGYIEMIKGNYPLAKKYFTILSRTCLYKKEAKHYLKLLATPQLIDNDPEIKKKRALLPDDDFIWNEQLHVNLNNYIKLGTDNKVAHEYFLGYALLSKNYEYILPTLETVLSKYYTDTEVPDIYQQALLSCYKNVTDSLINQYTIHDKNRELYNSFQKDVKSYSGIHSFNKYQGSYFYYIVKP